MWLQSTVVLASCAALVSAGFVKPPTDLKNVSSYAGTNVRYKEVPSGICETTEGVKSYSGYVDTGDNDHMFFWFFESHKDPKNAPLSVWFNGGPGSSSMIGLFQEVGPCRMYPNGTLYKNEYAWNKDSNLLVIDQPVTTGFSYKDLANVIYDSKNLTMKKVDGDECPSNLGEHETCMTLSMPSAKSVPSSTSGAAPTVWKILQGFFGAFPDYANTTLHLRTESYGGHYAPVFGSYILDQDAKEISNAIKLNLTSVVIGNGWIDPKIQYASYYNFTVSPGNTYDYKPYNESTSTLLFNSMYGKGNCTTLVDKCEKENTDSACRKAEKFCAANVEEVWDTLNRDYYDVRELLPDPFPYERYVKYLNEPHVLEAIGAYQSYLEGSDLISNTFWDAGDWGRSTMPYISHLLESKVPVIMHAGDSDYICNWIGNEVIANKVGGSDFVRAGYVNMEVDGVDTPGQVKQAGSFAYARVYYSGHEVPWYQPEAAYAIHHRALNGMDIATGKTKVSEDYATKGTPTSTFREGNATMQYHVLPSGTIYDYEKHAPVSSQGKQAR
ncbi:serine-type carboxypeptidase [Malassezia pachydermatis]|uniref:Carboxypeptidase n=1 Tax=Malassezia pachydermatis TaxID=77020 RepID=A0A0M8MZ96_9BASI|nr:carboxypeptidase 2 [Malassezia pachydermatis]KOS16521.1 carboxypeptidase 2 [Malassezia pachydermatis]